MDDEYRVVTIKTYGMQCSQCYKWRFIPSKEFYNSMEKEVFVCDKAKAWGKPISCVDAADFDDQEYITNTQPLVLRPSYPVPPEGFSKTIVIRGDKSSRFADIYYKSKDGKMLRSKDDVAKHLRALRNRYPGVGKDDFCFLMPEEYPRGENWRPFSIDDFNVAHVFHSEQLKNEVKRDPSVDELLHLICWGGERLET